jgi:hypothetical protein
LVGINATTKKHFEQYSTSLYEIQFSLDDSLIYFLSDAWGNERGLFSVNVKNGETRFVMGTSNYFQVIDSCKEKSFLGKLIVRPHFSKLDAAHHLIDWFFLVDKSAKRIGTIGPVSNDISSFLASRCGVGNGIQTRKRLAKLSHLKRSVTCPTGATLQPTLLLDNSIIDILVFSDHFLYIEEAQELTELLPLNCPNLLN